MVLGCFHLAIPRASAVRPLGFPLQLHPLREVHQQLQMNANFEYLFLFPT